MKIDAVTFPDQKVLPGGRQVRVIDLVAHAQDRAAYDLDFDPRLRLVRVRMLKEPGAGKSVFFGVEGLSMQISDAVLESERAPSKK